MFNSISSNMSDSKKPVVLIFIPETGIYPYLRSLAVLGDAIKKQGGKVIITRCTGQMSCYLMMGKPVTTPENEKKELCHSYAKRLDRMVNKYGFEIAELSEIVDKKMEKTIEELINTSEENWEKLMYRDFPVGQAAQFDFTLATKYLYSHNLSPHHQKIYLEYIKNIARAITLTERLCERYKPSLIMTFGEYGHYQGVRHAANLHNVRRMAIAHPMHYNTDFSRFLIWEPTNEFWFYPHCQRWDEGKSVPIRPEFVKECWYDIIYRLFSTGGTHIFSPRKGGNPGEIFNQLKLDPNKKTIVAYTSSYDERNAKDVVMKVWGEGPEIIDAFPSQIAWLTMLQEYAKDRKDVQIIVRVHPREGTRQFGFTSQHAVQLKEKFKENTSNFIMVWPDDPVSSYDLLEFADVSLVTWSLMGQEAARLGVPVLSCTGNMFYSDDDFIQVATNPEEYKRKLDFLVEMKFTWTHLVKAFRFYHWRSFVPSLDLGETIPADVDDDRVWPEVPPSKVGVINDFLFGRKDLMKYNFDEWYSSLTENSSKEEVEAMRWGIRSFIDKVFYPPYPYQVKFGLLYRIYRKVRKMIGFKIPVIQRVKDSLKEYSLEFSLDISRLEEFRHKTKKDHNFRVLIKDGQYAVLVHKGKVLRRMSPLIIRLAELHDESFAIYKMNT